MAPQRAGYTLLELIVVMALIGIVFFFAIPRFEGSFLLDDAKQSSRWLIGKLQALREEALRTHRRQILHIDLDANRLWDTSEAMTAEQRERAARRAQVLPGGGRLIAVDFPVLGRVTAGRAEIRFSPNGTSDRVILQVQHGDSVSSFLIEPFLAQVKMFDRMVGFDDARL